MAGGALPGRIAGGDIGITGRHLHAQRPRPQRHLAGDAAVADEAQGLGGGLAADQRLARPFAGQRSEEHTSELQSLMRISYAVFWLKKKTHKIVRYPHREAA